MSKPPMLNCILACAMVEGCTIPEAARKCDATQEDLIDAVRFRMSVAVDQDIRDYHESIYAAFKRLECMN